MYEKVFSTEFNISFFSPKKDQCCLCESYKNTNDPDEGLKSKYKLHIQQNELSRLEKNNDIKAARESQNILVACYDLQAVLQHHVETFQFYIIKENSIVTILLFTILRTNMVCATSGMSLWLKEV